MPWRLPQLSADGSRRLMMRGGSLSSHMQSDGVPAGRGARATDGIAAPTMPTRHQVAGTCPGGAHGCHVMREARQETPATHATHEREQSLQVALQRACLPMLRFLFASGSRCTGACTTCRCRHMGWGVAVCRRHKAHPALAPRTGVRPWCTALACCTDTLQGILEAAALFGRGVFDGPLRKAFGFVQRSILL